MKILQIINSLDIGGAERLITDLAPLMVKKDHEIDIVLLNGSKSPFLKELENNGCCNIITLGHSYYNPLYIFKIKHLIKNGGYDITHAHLFPSHYFAAIAKKITHKSPPLVVTEHSTGNKRMNYFITRWIDRLIYKSFDKLICISDGVKENVINKLRIDKSELNVIYNGINLDRINKCEVADRAQFKFTKEDIIIIMVASFRVQKDQDTLIKAIKELPSEYKLLLVGEGERRRIIEQLIDSLNLEGRVFLTGNRSDVFQLTKMADIAVISSHWEGFGLVAAEAMACGTPVIASNVAGLSQVVEGGGMLFERGDAGDLVNKILSLRSAKIYNHYQKAGLIQSQEYSINKMVDEYLNTYSSLTNSTI